MSGYRGKESLFGRKYGRWSFRAGRQGVLRVETRDVGSAESGVVDAVRRMERCGVVPDVGTAESPAMRGRRRTHIPGRNERSEPGSCLLDVSRREG